MRGSGTPSAVAGAARSQPPQRTNVWREATSPPPGAMLLTSDRQRGAISCATNGHRTEPERSPMSIEYAGYKPGTGFLTKLTNAIDRQQYTVSTVPKRKTLSGEHTYWELAVLKGGFFGTLFRPLFLIGNIAADEEGIRKIHHDVKEYVEEYSPAKWPRGALEYNTFYACYSIPAALDAL